MCIGSGFGLLAAAPMTAQAAQRYELSLAQGVEVQPQAIFVPRPNRELKMTLRRL